MSDYTFIASVKLSAEDVQTKQFVLYSVALDGEKEKRDRDLRQVSQQQRLLSL